MFFCLSTVVHQLFAKADLVGREFSPLEEHLAHNLKKNLEIYTKHNFIVSLSCKEFQN